MQQLSMLDLMMPPPPPIERKPYEPPPRRAVMTRAYGEESEMLIDMDEPDPIEIEVRGMPTVVKFSFAFQTYVIQPPGSAYWSETGFRSFAGFYGQDVEFTPDVIRQIIEAHIDRKHGLNGKITRWWPSYCLQWRQDRAFERKFQRSTTWDQWGPEKQAEHWANFDARQAAALVRMEAQGIDPEEVWKSR